MTTTMNNQKSSARPMTEAGGRRKKILVPVDFSPCSEHALQYARAFAGEFNARLILLHVVEAFPIDYLVGFESSRQSSDWLIEQSRKRLKRLARKLTATGAITGEPIVNFGKPFQEIVQVAKDRGADFIIIATHGYTGLKHIQLGSTTERVVRHASCPVLVVRAAEPGFLPASAEHGKA
jgi:nucleotide-binding universal stress UspA family protein